MLENLSDGYGDDGREKRVEEGHCRERRDSIGEEIVFDVADHQHCHAVVKGIDSKPSIGR